ncbi:MAG: S41 family peptidase [Candidatus Peregrinibacteria bacterium]|nr:S41 family peptidase [Candidatus Peregrinibacteria bacterium]
MIKKYLAAILSSFVFLTAVPTSLAHEYLDVPQGTSYYYPINYLRGNDVFKDTLYFYPDLIINKAEFIKYLVILNSPDFRPSSYADLPFEDTRNSAWYASYFEEAIRLGILDERDTLAEPDKKLTVIDAVALLFHSMSIPIPHVYEGYIPYTDVARNTRWQAMLMRALSLDVIRPDRPDYAGIYKRVTRAEAARMIYKMDLVTLGGGFGSVATADVYDAELEKLIDAWQLIESSYIGQDELDLRSLSEAAIISMVESLEDPYSTYYDEEENQAFLNDIGGQVEGIGAVIGINDNDEITIVSPIKDSPAMKAGLKSGDVVLKVDGTETVGMDLMEVVSMIKGPSGTTVVLTVRRDAQVLDISIVRAIVIIPSIDYELLDGGSVLHVSLYQFNENSPEQFQNMVDMINENPSIRGLILDLRGNPGGLLTSAISIMGPLVRPDAELMTIEYADYSQTIFNKGTGELVEFPVVVMIDDGSASASEIVAGALKDYSLAKLVGQTTFGKGTVQEVNYFADNSSLKLTVARWLTPLGFDIQATGVDPDYNLEDLASTSADEQLSKALSVVKSMY